MNNIEESYVARLRAAPDAPAVITPQATFTCAELDRAVSWTAREFERRGIGPGDVAAIDAPDQLRHLVASMALARLGAAQLPLLRGDPPLLRSELERRLGVVAVVGDGPQPAEMKRLQVAHFPPRAVEGTRPFLVRRSSGTSGVPRLGMLSHAGARHCLFDVPDDLPRGPDIRLLPFLHVGLFGSQFFALRCLAAGGAVVLSEPASQDPGSTLDLIRSLRVNFLYGTAVHAHWLLRATPEGGALMPELRTFAVGSTLIPQDLREAVRRRITAQLWIFYGISEIGVVSVAPPELVARIPGTVGVPVRGVETRITDDEGRELPAGYQGLLRVRSPAMMKGYLDDPEATAQVFRDGWFHSGDLVEKTTEGALIHYGRADDLIIYSGVNVQPTEIESVLLQHPAVAEAAAFGVPSPVHGHIPAAAVVLRSPVEAAALRKWCGARLGPRAPQTIVSLPALPRNAAGKVLKRELATRLAAEKPRT